MKGIDAIVYINGQEVAAQVGAQLNRSSRMVDVSNKIDMKWYEGLPQFNSWELLLNGSYVLNEQGFEKIEQAYLNQEPVKVRLQEHNYSFEGTGYIISFPLGARFNKEVSYSLTIKGTGKLEVL